MIYEIGERIESFPLFSILWIIEFCGEVGTDDMEIGEKLQLTIEDLSSDGNGVARLNDGYVFFVPFALPGEEVTATVSRLKKNYGIILELIMMV